MISIGHKVFLPGDQLIGLTTKILLYPGGQVSHLAIRIARLLGRNKMVPIAAVSDVTPSRVLLSINREQFEELPEYKGEVSSASIRHQAEQCVAEIPWVRGIINEICVTGMVLEPEDQRFLQPLG